MLVYPKIAHEALLIRAIFILEVYAYLVVAVTLKIRSSHAGYTENRQWSLLNLFFSFELFRLQDYYKLKLYIIENQAKRNSF